MAATVASAPGSLPIIFRVPFSKLHIRPPSVYGFVYHAYDKLYLYLYHAELRITEKKYLFYVVFGGGRMRKLLKT